MTDSREPNLWETPQWRASIVAQLIGRGISDRRASEIIAKMVKHYEAEDAKDRAYDARS